MCHRLFPNLLFKKLDKHLSSILWNKRIPSIRKAKLERWKDESGLALPIFMYYYWPYNIKLIHQAERLNQIMNLFGWRWNRLLVGHLTSNPLVNSSLKLWAQFLSHYKQKQALSLLPITVNALFPPSLIDHAFQAWSNKGIRCVRDFSQSGSFISFEHMTKAFDIPKSNFIDIYRCEVQYKNI